MSRSISLSPVLVATLLLASHLPSLHAAVVLTGDVAPSTPGGWAAGIQGFVGKTGFGTLDVNDDSDLESLDARIGYNAAATGVVTVDGTGSTWANQDNLYVGDSGNGTLEITNGGYVTNTSEFMANGHIGYNTGASGVVTVDGTGSTWSNQGHLYVGNSGTGKLEITNGGRVQSTSDCFAADHYIGYNADSTGVVIVDGVDSIWTNSNYNSRLSVGYRGNGILTIANSAEVSGLVSYIGFYEGSNGIVTIDGSGSTWTSSEGTTIGSRGSGTLEITHGATANLSDIFIGFSPDSTGVVRVDGDGSTLDAGLIFEIGYGGNGLLEIVDGGTAKSTLSILGMNSASTGKVTIHGTSSSWKYDSCAVGRSGNGTLEITGGGSVSGRDCIIGEYSGSTGLVSVSGVGTTWQLSMLLDVGKDGIGAVHVSDGASVTCSGYTTIGSQSLLTIDVGRGSALNCGENLDVEGVIQMVATPEVAPGEYHPITAWHWTGTGTYQAVGGVWNAQQHHFTVSPAETATAGQMQSINLANVQRLVISDEATGRTIGASFLAKTGDQSELNLTATPVDSPTLADLASLLGAGETARGAWSFQIDGDGYAENDPVCLSFEIAPDLDGPQIGPSDLNVWHFDGTEWTPFDATDLTFHGQFASFTVTSFSSYAVTAVPEPATLALLFPVAMAMLLLRRSRK